MGMRMTTISNSLGTGKLLKTEGADNHQASGANNTFSGILAMQAPAASQSKPASPPANTQGNTQNSQSINRTASQNKPASGKADNGKATNHTENTSSPDNETSQTDQVAASDNTADTENRTRPEQAPDAAPITNEVLPVNVLAEHAFFQQGSPGADALTGDKGGMPSLENTLLSQLIEPQRNLASRLSGKNPFNAPLETQATSGALAQFVKNKLAGSGQEQADTLRNTENTRLDAEQLAALDKHNLAGRAVNLNATKEATDQVRDTLFGRLSPDTVTADPTDPRNQGFKTTTQPLLNQAVNTLSEAAAANINANASQAISATAANTPAQAPASPLISIGTSFYHPGWSQAMAQQLATQASLFFRQQANGTHIAQMRLDPPELGPIKVSISIQDGVAQAAFVASNAAVRQALENSLADLHQALQEKGLSLGQAHVDQQDRQDSFFMEDNKTAGATRHLEGGTGILSDAGESVTTQPRQHDGLIKTFA